MERTTMLNTLPGFSGGKLPGRNTAEKNREEEEEDEASRGRQMKNEIARTSQSTVEQQVRQRWDSQIETREEEDVMEWHEEDECKEQWEDVKKMEVRLEQK